MNMCTLSLVVKVQLLLFCCLYCAMVKYSFRVRWPPGARPAWMLQWLTGRYVNSQLSCSPASESFNKHTRGTRVKVGAAIKHCGKPGDRWPEKFCNFPLFLNFYDFIVTAGLFWDLVSQFKPVWLCGYFETLTPIYWIAFYTKRHHTDSRLAHALLSKFTGMHNTSSLW